jgi:hypothetical protein
VERSARTRPPELSASGVSRDAGIDSRRTRRRGWAALLFAAAAGFPGGRVAAQARPPDVPAVSAAPATSPLAVVTTRTPAPLRSAAASSARTFCAEWVRQSRQGYERLTLFADGNVVWKRSRDGKDDLLRKTIAPEELGFYCSYFSRPEVFALPADLRTGLTGEFEVQSAVTVVRLDGERKVIRFDDFSPLPGEAAALRAALEGLKAVLTSPLAPASRFAPNLLAVGQILKRFDGVFFRIRDIQREKEVVELEGVTQPIREFKKIDELRFQFSPPE